MAKSKNLGEEIYSDTASFGRIMAIVGAVIATIIGIGMIIGGIIALHHITSLTAQIQGEVINKNFSPCSATAENNIVKYNCILNVKYTVNGKDYTQTLTTTNSNLNYNTGDSILIYYDPKNPSNSGLTSDTTKTLGYILLIAAPFVILLPWVWVYITKKSKIAAAAGGVATIFDMFRN